MPKTYKTEIIGYSFEELSEETQQEIYQKDLENFEEMVEFDIVEDAFREMLIEQFGASAETLEAYYDVSYSQGSGACCVGELDVDTVLEKRVGSYYQDLLEFIKVDPVLGYAPVQIESIQIVRCGPSNFYSHENTCCVEIDWSFEGGVSEEAAIEVIEELEEMLTNAIREELLNFHSNLRDHYEESTSFEVYCDLMSDSHIVYTEDGKVVDPMFIRDAVVFDGYQLKLDFEDHTDYNFT